MAGGTRFELDELRLLARLGKMTEKAQYALDTQVIRDTTPYVPYAQGTLAGSVNRASQVGKGVIQWQTPYATAQYYSMPYKSGAVHPNATMKWFEASRSQYLQRWVEVAKRAARTLS